MFKMRKQEQLYFPLELFIRSEPETKIMILEIEKHHIISDPTTTFTSDICRSLDQGLFAKDYHA